jgi:hypothetical protein
MVGVEISKVGAFIDQRGRSAQRKAKFRGGACNGTTMALTNAERQRRWREKQRAKQRAAPRPVHPVFGPMMTLEEALLGVDDPVLYAQAVAQFNADAAAVERAAQGEVDEEDE